jgi:hypothetical protein
MFVRTYSPSTGYYQEQSPHALVRYFDELGYHFQPSTAEPLPTQKTKLLEFEVPVKSNPGFELHADSV